MSDKTRPVGASKAARRNSQAYRVRNQDVVVPDGYLAVGHIIGVHGLRGEVKVELYTDFPERFAPDASVFLGPDLEKVKITAVRLHKNHLLLHFAGVTDRTAAENLRDRWLFVDEDDAAELEEGEYWIHEIMGLQVTDETGRPLGVIVDVLSTGSNDVYVIRPPDGQSRRQEILLPALSDVLLTVDLAQGKMTVRLPEGLIDPESVD